MHALSYCGQFPCNCFCSVRGPYSLLKWAIMLAAQNSPRAPFHASVFPKIHFAISHYFYVGVPLSQVFISSISCITLPKVSVTQTTFGVIQDLKSKCLVGSFDQNRKHWMLDPYDPCQRASNYCWYSIFLHTIL